NRFASFDVRKHLPSGRPRTRKDAAIDLHDRLKNRVLKHVIPNPTIERTRQNRSDRNVPRLEPMSHLGSYRVLSRFSGHVGHSSWPGDRGRAGGYDGQMAVLREA